MFKLAKSFHADALRLRKLTYKVLLELRAGNFVSLINKLDSWLNLRSLSTLMPFETSEVDLQSFVGIAGRETLSV